MKKMYVEPIVDKLEFDYIQRVTASQGHGKNPAQCQGMNPGYGCGHPGKHIGNNSPGNCTIDSQRKQPHQCT